MHSIVLYIVVLILVAHAVAHHPIDIYLPTCGHRASYGLYRVPMQVYRVVYR